jgi:hypothetical protein
MIRSRGGDAAWERSGGLLWLAGAVALLLPLSACYSIAPYLPGHCRYVPSEYVPDGGTMTFQENRHTAFLRAFNEPVLFERALKPRSR